MSKYDALLLVSFGGPERREEVIPFLENVLRGRDVPRERMLAVAEHYYHFDGRSPINDQNRELFTAHSVPVSMAQASPYVSQLEAASHRVAEAVGADDWKLVYQSRSGPPAQ